MIDGRLVIGGASGYWGEAPYATAQLLRVPGLDVLVYDYLAEITLSIMARARAKDPNAGFATDFITAAMVPNAENIAERGVKVISNAGGMNPTSCADALRAELSSKGLALNVAVVTGDDLLARADEFSGTTEMFSGAPYPEIDNIASVNAYLGALPIAAALRAGADIVITGRCVDSAVTLAACMHAFDWDARNYDLMAAGSLVGHLLECGPQATGGNFTDWDAAGDLVDIGYPVAEISADGSAVLTKPQGSTGLVTPATVGEQMLYEIGNPAAYLLPDVTCNFSEVTMTQEAENRVLVTGAKGQAPSGRLKVSTTFQDGWRAGYVFNFNGRAARQKAQAFAQAGLARASAKLRAQNAAIFADTCIEVTGGAPKGGIYEEVTLKAAVRHTDRAAVGLFLKDLMGTGLAAPPGLHGFTGAGRPAPSPVLALFSGLVDAESVPVEITLDGDLIPFERVFHPPEEALHSYSTPHPREKPTLCVPLETLAFARSGDKGNMANIGIIPRNPETLPYIWQALDDAQIRQAIPFAKGPIERFYLPGLPAMNLLLQDALGGGGIASLLNDAQGKGYAQRLLCIDIPVPKSLLEKSQ